MSRKGLSDVKDSLNYVALIGKPRYQVAACGHEVLHGFFVTCVK
jgi:hypothetical protein